MKEREMVIMMNMINGTSAANWLGLKDNILVSFLSIMKPPDVLFLMKLYIKMNLRFIFHRNFFL